LKGALTSEIDSFRGRPWEFSSRNSIDIFDGSMTPVKIDYKGYSIKRVTPNPTDSFKKKMFNFPWLSDKSRYSSDSLDSGRVKSPSLLIDHNLFVFVSFPYVEKILAFYVGKSLVFLTAKKKFDFVVSAGTLTDLKSLEFFKFFSNIAGFDNLYFEKNLKTFLSNSYPHNTLNSVTFDNYSNIILVGLNTKKENVLLTAKLRCASSKINIFSVGSSCASSFTSKTLGNDSRAVFDLVEGRHKALKFIDIRETLIVYGYDFINQSEGLESLLRRQHNFCFLFNSACHLNSLESGVSLVNGTIFLKQKKVVYNLNTEFYRFSVNSKNNDFSIFQGHHSPNTPHNLIIPDNSFLESKKYFFNFLGGIVNTAKIPKKKSNSWKTNYFYASLLSVIYENSDICKRNILRKSPSPCDRLVRLNCFFKIKDIYIKKFVAVVKQNPGRYSFLFFNEGFKKYINLLKMGSPSSFLKFSSVYKRSLCLKKNGFLLLDFRNFFINNLIAKNSCVLQTSSKVSFFFSKPYSKTAN
jgi:hypothetical protein